MPVVKQPRKTKNLQVLGWREWVRIPAIGTDAIGAKVDTGAETCSLHASRLRVVQNTATFQLRRSRIQLPVKEMRLVRSSNGESALRPVVELEVTIGSSTRLCEFTLADRGQMKFPVLIGRNFLSGEYVVDVSRSYTQGRPGAEA